MKISECRLGQEVTAWNSFGCHYFVSKINKTTVWLEYREEGFLPITYKNNRPGMLKLVKDHGKKLNTTA